MKPSYPTDLGQCLMRFFQDYLPMLRGMSVHTIHSYRDTLVLWLQFTARETARAIRVRLTRARRKLSLARLKAERARLYDGLMALAEGLELPVLNRGP